jgi:hypothetical protein
VQSWKAEAASRVERWRRLAERRGRRAGVTGEACGAALGGVQVVAFPVGEILGEVDVVGRSGAVVGRGAVVESVGRRVVLIVVGVGGLGAGGEILAAEMRGKAAGGADTTHLACPAALREGDLGVVLPAAKHALPTALLGREGSGELCTASGDMAGLAGILGCPLRSEERRRHVVEDGGGDGGGVAAARRGRWCGALGGQGCAQSTVGGDGCSGDGQRVRGQRRAGSLVAVFARFFASGAVRSVGGSVGGRGGRQVCVRTFAYHCSRGAI